MNVSKGILSLYCVVLLTLFTNTQAERLKAVPTQNLQASLSATDAIKKLKAGNKRFLSDNMTHRNYIKQAKKSSAGQFPWAVVLNCMDSRSIPEILFDTGIAELFTLRVAGNVLNEDIIGSMEFATKVVGSKVIVVMGHTACGAVHGACAGVNLGHLDNVLDKIKPAVTQTQQQTKMKDCGKPELIDDIAKTNAKMMAKQITQQSPIIASLVKKGDIKIIAAMHNITTGQVTFFDE